MPVESKPLFRPDVLRAHLTGFSLPERVAAARPALVRWAELLESGRASALKEQELLPDFLTDVFLGLLGYTGPAGGAEHYSLSREQHVEVGGKFADAVLGRFGPPKNQYIVALEGKGPRDPLDRPFAGRAMSAVDQAYRYAINLRCDWVIVTNLHEVRLYHKGSDQQTYERFQIERLADDDAQLVKFVFLLGAERVVPAEGAPHFAALLAESEQVGRQLTKQFYTRYAEMRREAYARLAADNPAVPKADVLTCTQKLLDRVLFCAFCEDRGLLPAETIARAYQHRDPYHPRPIWDNFRGLFRSIDSGNATLRIHAYNGGLFALDPLLDERLLVADQVCGYFQELSDYDYRPASAAAAFDRGSQVIDVEILGHIFEQSISDLERLRNELAGAEPPAGDKPKSRRKQEGAFYTPAFITRYIIEQALGGVLADRFERLRQTQANVAKASARAALADPRVYDLAALKKPGREALVAFWEAWQDELREVRILDPACGSGAFLIEAFDQLHAMYRTSNDRLYELRGERTLFDLDRQILENNLYGVDLNDEAIEICRLSLWIKTASVGKALTSLDHTIRVGNSVVADPAVHPRAFDWQAAFPEVFAGGGFDVVVGNPPYVRQEMLSAIKPYLQEHYAAYHGMADLYVYFYELGLRVLRPGGRLSLVVTNKWMKAGYGEPLRKLFGERAWMESVVDFGHAKEIFEDADVFPSIIVARKPTEDAKPKTARLCAIPREQLRIDDLSRQIAEEGSELPLDQLREEAWQLEPAGVAELLAKVRSAGASLFEFLNCEPLSGIKTGLNEAFLVSDARCKELIAEHPRSVDVLRRYLRGQDFERWNPNWAGFWMIALRSSDNYSWPWSDKSSHAEPVFKATYPAIYRHLAAFQEPLMRRQDQGRFWWELRSCAYWGLFDKPKIMYPEITWRPSWAMDAEGTLCNNTAYILPSPADPWVLAVANSPIAWWYSWRTAIHGKDEALRFIKEYARSIPIAAPANDTRARIEPIVDALVASSRECQTAVACVLEWLRVECEVAKSSLRLQAPLELAVDGFATEVRKCRGRSNPLSAAGLKNLREEYARTIAPARALQAEALGLERQVSDLVNEAYGLTPEEIDLMWRTAPPRMPIAPVGSGPP